MATLAEPDIDSKILRGRFREAAVNHPHYRAICLEPGCPWHWKSEDEPENPKHARTKASAHRDVEGHRSEVVFDIYAQHDTTFLPRGER